MRIVLKQEEIVCACIAYVEEHLDANLEVNKESAQLFLGTNLGALLQKVATDGFGTFEIDVHDPEAT